MSKYMVRANYTQSGLAGLIQEGGSSRRRALTQTVESLGGSLEAMYYAFGECDAYLIVDFTDDATASAFSLAVGAAGALDVTITVLISPETVDEAISKDVTYRPPGE